MIPKTYVLLLYLVQMEKTTLFVMWLTEVVNLAVPWIP